MQDDLFKLFDDVLEARMLVLDHQSRQRARRDIARRAKREQSMDIHKSVRDHIFGLLGTDVPEQNIVADKAASLFPHYLRFLEEKGSSDVHRRISGDGRVSGQTDGS